jgi:hypothetical protein
MLLTSLPLFLAAILVTASLPVAPPAQVPSGGLGYDLELLPGERLLSYRWDGGDSVPFLAGDSRVRIVFGERGLDRGSRLYLPAHALNEGVSTGANMVSSQDLELVEDGPFGRALGLSATSYLRLTLPAMASDSGGWTTSFWVRPQASGFGRSLVLLPGAVEVLLQADGRVRAVLLPGGEQVTSTLPIAAGAWSFVVVSHDPLLTRQVRLFVDGRSVCARLGLDAPARQPRDLYLGDLARNGRGFVGDLDELLLDPFPLSTAQAQSVQQRRPLPGSHLLELITTSGLRRAQPAAGITRELVLDDAAKFAAGALRGVVLENGELVWAPGRWLDLAPRRAPAPRTTHPLVSLGDQRVLTFGGETRDTHLSPMVNTDDTWIFAGATNTWERVSSLVSPSPRCHVPVAYSPDHDLALMVGGWRNDGHPNSSFGDTWVFHAGTGQWEQRFPGGDPIGTGSDFGLVYLPALGQFLLLHGQRNALYDPVVNRWQRLPLSGAATESGLPATFRVGGSPMCALDPTTGLVLVFGGAHGPAQDVFSDTTALYDVQTNSYTVLDTPTRPAARVRAAFAYDPARKYFVMFGGVRGQFSQRYDDLWVFAPATRQWFEVDCSNRPSPRGGYFGMAHDEVADRFVLYGGRNSPERWLDETLALELRPERAGTALFTFDRGANPTHNTWFADVTTPANSSVRFLFRGSAGGAHWSRWRPSTAGLADRRFLQAVAFLTPGAGGQAPSIQRIGLR